MSLVTISDSAVTYLQDLLNSQEEETNIKIFVSDPGTMRAETCIVYCKVGEEEEDDVLMEVGDLSVYLENESLPFLEDCKVDYHPDKFGGQLTIRAPNAKVPSLKDHRICMSASILALISGAQTYIKNFETVFTSSPSFLRILKQLGGEFEKK